MVGRRIPIASEAERAELESVLRSKLLLRSPSVLRIAEYIARTYLDGDAEDIKEYNIAVDALGKPADFDPKRDSIVRVEVHRLRKKVETFYATEGRDHALRLVIDPGTYVPRFETAQAVAVEVQATAEETLPAPLTEVALPVIIGRRVWWRSRWALFVPLLAALAVVAWYRAPFKEATVPEPIFLLAGTPTAQVIVADAGFIFHGDRWFKGGNAVYPAPALALVPEGTRSGQRVGDFDYAIPLADAPWELRLYFGPRNSMYGEQRQIARGFDVRANNVSLMSAQDPDVGEALSQPYITRVFRDIRPGPDHLLHLSFRSGRETAYVSAIGLTAGHAGSLSPIRLISKSAPWTDVHGNTWGPDAEFVSGGTLKLRTKIHAGGLDPNVVAGERYGDFSYNIPVSKGTYRLKLYFAESWFGEGMSGGGGVRSRRFDVYAERQPLLLDFDIYREAGHKPLVKEFHGLQPNADGYISLRFIPRANFAAVNALELVEEPGFK